MTIRSMTIRDTVLNEITRLLTDKGLPVPVLTDDLLLLDTGADSLGIAVMVANIEDETGLDPFGTGNDIEIPATIGDLIRIYEQASDQIVQ